MSFQLSKSAAAFAMALILTASPTMSAAATQSMPAPVNPLAVVGVFGSPAAVSALCGNAAAAAAAQAPNPGCVLPVVDTVPPPPVPEAAYIPPPVAGTSMFPALLVIGGIIAAALVASTFDDDDDDDGVPVSAV